jgi:hypothetical protein
MQNEKNKNSKNKGFIYGEESLKNMVFRAKPFPKNNLASAPFGVMDNDLAVDNLSNDMTVADRDNM